jgi:hypothetical protein
VGQGCALLRAAKRFQGFRRLFLQLRNSATPQLRFARRMFFPSRFSSLFKSSEGLAPFVALDQGFGRETSTNVIRPRASKWAGPKECHPSPASSAEGRGQTEARRLQENNIRSLGRTRFEPISSRTGASPSFLRHLATPACFEPILRFPFFEAERPSVGAHLTRRHPATLRT